MDAAEMLKAYGFPTLIFVLGFIAGSMGGFGLFLILVVVGGGMYYRHTKKVKARKSGALPIH